MADREDVNTVLSVVEAIVRQHLEKGASRDGSIGTATKDFQHLEMELPIQGGASLCCLNTLRPTGLAWYYKDV